MSYDVSIGKFDCNQTYNYLAQMCYDCLDEDNGLRSLNGLAGWESEIKINWFFKNLENRCAAFHSSSWRELEYYYAKLYHNSNWGGVTSAVAFMGQLQLACAKNPNKTVQIW